MKKRNVMILVILLIVGFASVSTTLVLNGVIGIGSDQDDFNIIFTNAKLNNIERKDFIDPDTKQTLTFETNKLTTLDEEAILDYEVTNTSRLYDGEVVINCIVPENEYVTVEYEPKSMEVKAGESKIGKITARLVKASIEDSNISIKCTLSANAVERDTLGEEYKGSPWKITEDNDDNGVLSKGDLITIDTESFYVYDIEGDKVKAIAQYNLYVGGQINDTSLNVTPLENPTGLQNPLSRGGLYEKGNNVFPSIGVVPFTTEEKYNRVIEGITENIPKPNDYSISTIKEYVDEYAYKLKDLNADVNTVRLITKEELEAAGCDSSKYSCLAAPEYLYSTSYWTSWPDAEDDNLVWDVNSRGYFVYNDVSYDGGLGVRPVIEVSASLF